VKWLTPVIYQKKRLSSECCVQCSLIRSDAADHKATPPPPPPMKNARRAAAAGRKTTQRRR